MAFQNKARGLVLCVISVCCGIGCIHDQAQLQRNSVDNRVDSIFTVHFTVLRTAFRENLGKYSVEDLNRSVEFFETITQVKGRRDHTPAGDLYMSPNALNEDIRIWEEWYDKNKQNLYWDFTTNSVMLSKRI